GVDDPGIRLEHVETGVRDLTEHMHVQLRADCDLFSAGGGVYLHGLRRLRLTAHDSEAYGCREDDESEHDSRPDAQPQTRTRRRGGRGFTRWHPATLCRPASRWMPVTPASWRTR